MDSYEFLKTQKNLHVAQHGALTIREFQRISVERAQLWHRDKAWSPDKWVTAFVGEFGEFCNELKKRNRDDDELESHNERRVSLAKELADSFAYLVLLADSVGVDLESETVRVFNAISEREGFDIKIRSAARDVCVVCGVAPVTPEDGQDTCSDCAKRV